MYLHFTSLKPNHSLFLTQLNRTLYQRSQLMGVIATVYDHSNVKPIVNIMC